MPLRTLWHGLPKDVLLNHCTIAHYSNMHLFSVTEPATETLLHNQQISMTWQNCYMNISIFNRIRHLTSLPMCMYDVRPSLLPLLMDVLQILVTLKKKLLSENSKSAFYSAVLIFAFGMIKKRKFAFVANNIACSYLWMDWKAWEICWIRVFKELWLPDYHEFKKFSHFVNNFMAFFHQRSHLGVCGGYFFYCEWRKLFSPTICDGCRNCFK